MATKTVEKEEDYMTMESKLKTIISALSDSSLSLEKQIQLGEQGQILIQKMQAKLDEMQKKVDSISKLNNKNPQ